MAVDDGHQQRAGLVAGAHLVDVGAGVEQRLRGLDVSLARGEQQRRQPALRADQLVEAIRRASRRRRRRRRLCAAGAGALPRRVLPPVRRARCRLLLRAPSARRDRRPSVVDLVIGAAREQQLHRVDAVEGGGEHQRRLPCARPGVDVRAGLEQRSSRRGVAGRGREHQRRRAGRRSPPSHRRRRRAAPRRRRRGRPWRAR